MKSLLHTGGGKQHDPLFRQVLLPEKPGEDKKKNLSYMDSSVVYEYTRIKLLYSNGEEGESEIKPYLNCLGSRSLRFSGS